MACHFPLQGIFPTQRSYPGLLHFRQILYRLSHQGSLSHHRDRAPSLPPTGGCHWAGGPWAKSAPRSGCLVSLHGRKIKCLELHPGESQAGLTNHPQAPQPGWGRPRGEVVPVRAAAAARDPPSSEDRERCQGEAPAFRARRPFVPNTRARVLSEDKAAATLSTDAPGYTLSWQEWRAGGCEGHAVTSPAPLLGKDLVSRELGIERLVRVGTVSARPASTISECALGSHFHFGDPEAYRATAGSRARRVLPSPAPKSAPRISCASLPVQHLIF